MLSITTNTV